jgi:hypothetical protein
MKWSHSGTPVRRRRRRARAADFCYLTKLRHSAACGAADRLGYLVALKKRVAGDTLKGGAGHSGDGPKMSGRGLLESRCHQLRESHLTRLQRLAAGLAGGLPR